MAMTKPSSSQVTYSGTTVNKVLEKSVLSYDTYSSASAAAATLPDGQVVDVSDSSTRYDVSGGALIDARPTVPLSFVASFVRSVQDRLKDFVSVKDFGAIGDGVDHHLSERFTTLAMAQAAYPHATSLSDSIDWAAIQYAMNFASTSGKNVFAPAGHFVVGNDKRLENPGVMVYGAGDKTLFEKIGQNSLFRTLGTMPDKASGFSLSANAAESSDEITLAAGAGASISTDALYVLIDESQIFAELTGKKGEFVRVREVVGDTLKLWRYLKFGYATSASAKLMPVSLTEGVAYKDFKIKMDDAATVTSSNTFQEGFAIDLRWCKSPKVESVGVTDSLLAGIFLNGCYGARITGYRAERFGSNTTGTDNPASVDGLPGFGYGVREESLNEGLILDGMEAVRCRNAYDTTAGYTALFNHGEPTGSVISNSTAIDPRGAGFGTHWAGYGIEFNNITVIGGRRNAVSVRSRSTKVNGITALNCRGPAVWLRGGDGGDPSLRADDCVVSGVLANRTNLGTDLYDTQDWREFGAVVDEGRRNTISDVTAIKTGGGILSIGHNGIARQGVYRGLVGRDVCQLATKFPDAVRVVNANTLADFSISDVDVHSSDSKVRHIVSRETATTFDSKPINVTTDGIRGTGITGKKVTSVTNMLGMRPDSGTYIPVQVGTNTNVTSVTHAEAQFLRVGNTVTVSGRMVVNAASAADVVVRMSLPIDSDFTANENLAGFARNSTGVFQAACYADSANNCAVVQGPATATGGNNVYYQFTYQVR